MVRALILLLSLLYTQTAIGQSFPGQLQTDTLLGRDTAGVGKVESITLGAGLDFDGSKGLVVDLTELTVTPSDADYGDVIVTGGVWDLDEASVETELEGVLDVADLQGYSAVLTEAEAASAYQPLDGDLTSWASVTRAAGFDTFAATPSSANIKSLVTDETGSGGALVFATDPDISISATTESNIETAIDTLDNLTNIGAADSPTKGDLLVGDGSAWDDLAVGADDLCLISDSGETLGIKWGTCSAGTGDNLGDHTATEALKMATFDIDFGTGDVVIDYSANALAFTGVTGDYSFDDTVGVTGSVTASVDVTATAGDVTSGDDIIVGDDVNLIEGASLNWDAGDCILAQTGNSLDTTGCTISFASLAGVQGLDSDLTSWAGVTRASGFDTFVATPTSANLRSLLTDESGTGNAYFQGGDAGTPSAIVLTNATGLTSSGVAVATLVTAADTVVGNDNDTTWPTTAAIIDYAQPLDADLTSIASLTTTAAGRSILTVTDPNVDRLPFWDDSAGTMKLGVIADFTAEASPASGDKLFIQRAGTDDLAVIDWDDLPEGLGGTTGGADLAVLRADGSGGSTVQASPLLLSDAGELSLSVNSDSPFFFTQFSNTSTGTSAQAAFGFQNDAGGSLAVGVTGSNHALIPGTAGFNISDAPGGLLFLVDDGAPAFIAAAEISFGTLGSPAWTIDNTAAGVLIPGADDTYDIGSAAVAVANIFALNLESNTTSLSLGADGTTTLQIAPDEDTLAAELPSGSVFSALGIGPTILNEVASGNAALMTLKGGGDAGAGGAIYTAFGFGDSSAVQLPAFFGFAAGGTSDSRTAMASGKTLFSIGAGGWDGSAYGGTFGADAIINFTATEDFDGSGHGTQIAFNTTPNNSTTSRVVGVANQDGSWGFGTTWSTTEVGDDHIVTGAYEIGHASDTTLARSAAGEATLEGDAVKHAGKQFTYIPASGMRNSALSPASCGDTYDSGSNDVTITVCAFDTGATEENAEFGFSMPKAWNEGTITMQFEWTNIGGSAAQTVQWKIACTGFGDDDALNTAYPADVTVSDTFTATNDFTVTAETGAITVQNAAENDHVHCRIGRDTSADDLGGDALLIGARLFWTDNQSTLAE